jgi:hypothetical protein
LLEGLSLVFTRLSCNGLAVQMRKITDNTRC